jgi:hypothetical protein
MGRGGPGYFDSDTTSDYVAELEDRLVKEVEEASCGTVMARWTW